MDVSKIDATEIAAIIAFGGVLTSAAVAYLTASRSVFVNAITTSRIKWIESVRKLVLELRNHSLQASYDLSKGIEIDQRVVGLRVVQITEELRLTLGQGRNEDNVIRLAEICCKFRKDFERAKEDNILLAGHTQWLLRAEWRKVKAEAAPQLLRIKGYESKKLIRGYALFCENEGRFDFQDGEGPISLSSPASAARP